MIKVPTSLLFSFAICGERENEAAADMHHCLDFLDYSPDYRGVRYLEAILDLRPRLAEKYNVEISTVFY